jgi:hypothetical protein
MKRSLSDEQVKQIRELYNTGDYTMKSLARKFKCSIATIDLWLDEDDSKRIKKFFNYGGCEKCGAKMKSHPRCQYCGILIHEDGCKYCNKHYKNFNQDINNLLC